MRQAPVVKRADNFIHWIDKFAFRQIKCMHDFHDSPIIWNRVELMSNLRMGLCGKLANSIGCCTFVPLDSDLSSG